MHRHDGHDLFLITQHPMLIDGNLRRLVGRHYHVVRFYGFNKSTIHEFTSVREQLKSLKGSMEKHFPYPKEVFTWYKSSDMHTMKRRIPARLVLVVVLPLLLIAALWWGYRTIAGLGENHQVEVQKEQGGMVDVKQPQQQHPAPPQAQKLDWYAQQVERVPGLPHTRPVYDEITKPVTAPINAACVDFRGQCKCYTQQGTELATDQALCKQIIAKGFFIDFDPGTSAAARVQQTERAKLIADRQRQDELTQRHLERAASERSEARQGETVAPASVDVQQPGADEVRSPSKIARERTAASQWAFDPHREN
ncbi:zonular occludens toxin domain-containing protein [Methylobacillus glycogenes]|uniref:zonular occludens toxin domain-containing protein n=1 Tax=Methylobacillus glycogenes TaxID=406 RepID=UPI001F46D6CF